MPSFIEHTLDIYGVTLYQARNGREWAAIRKSREPQLGESPKCAGMTEMHTSNDGSMTFTVYVRPTDDPREVINTCAHEAAHVAGQILDAANAEYDGLNEPFAYLVGWITQWLWTNMQEAP